MQLGDNHKFLSYSQFVNNDGDNIYMRDQNQISGETNNDDGTKLSKKSVKVVKSGDKNNYKRIFRELGREKEGP